MTGAQIGAIIRGAPGRKPVGRTIPAGPLGLTGCPGAAVLGLTIGLLAERGPLVYEAFKNSSVHTVSARMLPSIMPSLISADFGP